jgi:5-methylcytosine-specific restriction enzyme A
MADTIPSGISREHILRALRDLDLRKPHLFADSTKYDLLFQGRRYPPKAVLGLAAQSVEGREFGPYDFKGGRGSKCFRILEQAGFEIVRKPGIQFSK